MSANESVNMLSVYLIDLAKSFYALEFDIWKMPKNKKSKRKTEN